MSANEDYLDNLLKSMNGENAEEAEEGKAASMMSLDEIEAMFDAAEKVASEGSEQTSKEPEEFAASEAEEHTDLEADGIEELADLKADGIEELADLEADGIEELADLEADGIEELADLKADGIEELADLEAEETGELATSETEELEEFAGLEAAEPEEVSDLSEELSVDAVTLSADAPKTEDMATEEEDPIWKMLVGLDEEEELPVSDTAENAGEMMPEEISAEDSEDILSLLDQQELTSPAQQENPFAEMGEQNAAGESSMPDYADLFGEEGSILTDTQTGGDGTQPDKKEGKVKRFFRNLMERMTEEDEPEGGLSEENRTVMEELDAEDRAAAGKKKKKKKGKMPAGEQGEAEDGQADEKGKKAGKGQKKPAKAKKAKPEKKPKETAPEEREEKPSKRISPKSIAVVILFALTIFAVVYFGGNLFSERLQKNAAKKAFEVQDYLTCYESLYGTTLSEKEKEMYTHAETVLRMERRIAVYEGYLKEGRELEALDSLMRVIAGYEKLFTTARECGAAAEVEALYQEVLRILQDQYGVSETDARTIVNSQSNVDYTRYLTALTEGGELSLESGGGLELPPEELTDVLPLETELDQNLQEQGGLTE